MERTILHCDLNAFYAAVECLYRPELRDVPMAVAGDMESRRGIILAKNELAKQQGVITAEAIWQARRKCPDLVLVPPRHGRYRKYSLLVHQIYDRYTDMVESFGIDEAWLDVSGSRNLFGSGREIADEIRAAVRTELGLTVSVGVSFNKVLAKLGSDYKKPDATTVIDRENYKEIAHPLPVSELMYVGPAVTAVLAKLGIKTIGQLAGFDKKMIVSRLGKGGAMIHDYANGLDDSPVGWAHESREVKSIGNGMTFRRNLLGIEDIRAGVAALSDTVATRLRKAGLKCSTVQVVIKDPGLKSISRQKKLAEPVHLAREISAAAIDIIKSAWGVEAPIRMLTITGLQLVGVNRSEQLTLFGADEAGHKDKMEKLEATLDAIRIRYGKGAIYYGSVMNNDMGLADDGARDEE